MVSDSRVWDENGFLVSGAVTHPIDDALPDVVPGLPVGTQPDLSPREPEADPEESAPDPNVVTEQQFQSESSVQE